MRFSQRLAHCGLFLGLPLAVWESFDLWSTARGSDLFGTEAVAFGVLYGLLAGAGTAIFAALIEHGLARLLVVFSKKQSPYPNDRDLRT
jgi:hypothetical protein